MVGPVERDEAFGMFRRAKDPPRVVDAHSGVTGRVQHQKGGVQARQGLLQRGRGDVVQKFAADFEGPARQIDRGAPMRADFIQLAAKIMRDMAGVERGADRHHGPKRGKIGRGLQHGRAAQRVPDQKLCRQATRLHERGGKHQVGDVRCEMRIGEFAPGMTQPGEVEPKNGDAKGREPTRDPARRRDILGTCEAMREDRRRPDRAAWQIQSRGKHVAGMPGKGDLFAFHLRTFWCRSGAIGAGAMFSTAPVRSVQAKAGLACAW